MKKITMKDITCQIAKLELSHMERTKGLSWVAENTATRKKLVSMIKQYRKQGYENGKENCKVRYVGEGSYL